MALRVIVEFQAKPGARAELASALEGVMAALGPIPGLVSSTLYEVLDTTDALIEIADWESAEAQAAAVARAMESGVYGRAFELVAVPPRATRVRRVHAPG